MELGKLVQQSSGYKAFIPNEFPPDELLKFSESLVYKHSTAQRLLGKLDGITELLPDINFFLLMYIRKDATSSSQIEGTQATMMDAIDAVVKNRDSIPNDVDDILHYIEAVNYGLERLNEFPLSLRFIREVHNILMKEARTYHNSSPGEFRKSQNWIGGTTPENARFVPPPHVEMNQALDDFEDFIHKKDNILPLLKTGLLHAQFETIHPFLDGNGRTGRLLIILYLIVEKLIDKPILFLSAYFKRFQKIYYDRLDGYHQGEVESWLDFFLDGIIDTSEKAIITVKEIAELQKTDHEKLLKLSKKASISSLDVMKNLYRNPVTNVKLVSEWTGFTLVGAQNVIDRLVDLDILRQRDETEKYNRLYIYKRYVDIFSKD